jgi:glutaconyl-CoA/methylmalonyl-CoA decarboxylase subunit delta
MDTIELLQKFADPEVMQTLSLSNRLIAGLITTMLGMGITCISLIILQIVIQLTTRFAAPKQEKEVSVAADALSKNSNNNQPLPEEEIVAAITTALAVQLKTSVSNIVIRNIEKVGETSSTWHKAGIAEQMNNSL